MSNYVHKTLNTNFIIDFKLIAFMIKYSIINNKYFI